LTFSALLAQRAARSLRKLQSSTGARIAASLKELEVALEIGEQLKPSRFWKVKVGDYRVIYEIDKSSNRVILLFVGHRKNVYDEFSRLV
jgi:mRNA interferase RelE/StbE